MAVTAFKTKVTKVYVNNGHLGGRIENCTVHSSLPTSQYGVCVDIRTQFEEFLTAPWDLKKICAHCVRSTIGAEHKQYGLRRQTPLALPLTNLSPSLTLCGSTAQRIGLRPVVFSLSFSLFCFLWNELLEDYRVGFLENRPLLQSWQIIFGSLSFLVCGILRLWYLMPARYVWVPYEVSISRTRCRCCCVCIRSGVSVAKRSGDLWTIKWELSLARDLRWLVDLWRNVF